MVKRLTLNEAIEIDIDDFLRLDTKELRQYVRTLSDVANKRVKSFEGLEVKPRVITRAIERGKFSTKGKNLNQLRAEYTSVRSFLLNPSSTKKGFKKVMKDTEERLKSRGMFFDEDELLSFDDVYNRLKEIDPELFSKRNRYQTIEILKEIANRDGYIDLDSIIEEVRRRSAEIYEETQGDEDIDVSVFFGI